MYSTLLFVVALLSGHVLSAKIPVPSENAERRDREFWSSKPNFDLDNQYFPEDLPSSGYLFVTFSKTFS